MPTNFNFTNTHTHIHTHTHTHMHTHAHTHAWGSLSYVRALAWQFTPRSTFKIVSTTHNVAVYCWVLSPNCTLSLVNLFELSYKSHQMLWESLRFDVIHSPLEICSDFSYDHFNFILVLGFATTFTVKTTSLNIKSYQMTAVFKQNTV